MIHKYFKIFSIKPIFLLSNIIATTELSNNQTYFPTGNWTNNTYTDYRTELPTINQTSNISTDEPRGDHSWAQTLYKNNASSSSNNIQGELESENYKHSKNIKKRHVDIENGISYSHESTENSSPQNEKVQLTWSKYDLIVIQVGIFIFLVFWFFFWRLVLYLRSN